MTSHSLDLKNPFTNGARIVIQGAPLQDHTNHQLGSQ